MSASLQEWIEAALIVADSNGMSDDEVIPTWPDFRVERFPDRYLQLTVGALREWRASRQGSGKFACPNCEAEFENPDNPGDVCDDCAADAPQPESGGWIADVTAERQRQDRKWGGPEHDDRKSPNDFVQHIEDYAGWARVMAGMGSFDKYRRRMVQVAALAGAAVEASDRAVSRAQSPAEQEGG